MVIPFSIKLNFLQDETASKLQRNKGCSVSRWDLYDATQRMVTINKTPSDSERRATARSLYYCTGVWIYAAPTRDPQVHLPPFLWGPCTPNSNIIFSSPWGIITTSPDLKTIIN